MMKRLNWQIVLITILLSLSVLLYALHFFIFKDAHHVFIYLLGDIAFVPIEVLLVTLIIHRILNIREKRILLKKLNMVIGAFFSEVGLNLLKYFVQFDSCFENIRKDLIIKNDWSDHYFTNAQKNLNTYACTIDMTQGNLGSIKNFLIKKRDFLLRLLENPNLLEHESFTELLWAIFHLTDELLHRKELENLPKSDLNHLAGDIKRAYILLISEWLMYMKHLKNDYPYLFSLALRTNPLDPDASPIVK